MELCKNGPEICCESCERFRPFYEAVKLRPRWLTISPPYSHEDPDDFLKGWYEEFYEFRYFGDKIFGVMEEKQGRLHFHLIYELKDRIKEYRVLNKIRKNAMVRVYDGYPRDGLHYLMKDIDVALELCRSYSPVITSPRIEVYHKKRNKKSPNKLLYKSVFEKWELSEAEA